MMPDRRFDSTEIFVMSGMGLLTFSVLVGGLLGINELHKHGFDIHTAILTATMFVLAVVLGWMTLIPVRVKEVGK